MRYLSLILLLLFVPVTSAAPPLTDWKSIAANTSKSIVYVESDEGKCTGFVINASAKGDMDYVMTATHCLGKEMFADSTAAKVIWKDTKHDLMVLEIPDTGRPALRLAAKNPEIGEEVASYGYGYALTRPMFRTAHVSDDKAELTDVDGGPFVMIDAAFVSGQSGGPCINLQGELVSIVQRASGLIGVGIGVEKIKDRAGKYFEKP
jgi:S1-C subfamily serine protease